MQAADVEGEGGSVVAGGADLEWGAAVGQAPQGALTWQQRCEGMCWNPGH